jgi:hypothetical protein
MAEFREKIVPVQVFFTVDVEIWCDGWKDIDSKFNGAFRRYVYGDTPAGKFGLPFIVKTLRDHGLVGNFFTESLFAARFGLSPLTEIVQIIASHGQDIQLHLHPEWADEATVPLLPQSARKRPLLRDFTANEQVTLIAKGIELLEAAGAAHPIAFRAGSFGLGRDTFGALEANAIAIDASYNYCQFGQQTGISPEGPLLQPARVDGITEYPMSFFIDGLGRPRHAQVGACSFRELRDLLETAAAESWHCVVLLFHNFELLDPSQRRADRFVIRRFEQLCRYLSDHRDVFRCGKFEELDGGDLGRPAPPKSSLRGTLVRYAEQGLRRFV